PSNAATAPPLRSDASDRRIPFLLRTQCQDDDQGRAQKDQPQRGEYTTDGRDQDLERSPRCLGPDLEPPLDPHLSRVRGDRARDGYTGALGVEDAADQRREILDPGRIGHLLEGLGPRTPELDLAQRPRAEALEE